jgi:hypothetical protein
MSEQDPELQAFAKFIGAIEPWLDEAVLIGGWAHRLYRLHLNESQAFGTVLYQRFARPS